MSSYRVHSALSLPKVQRKKFEPFFEKIMFFIFFKLHILHAILRENYYIFQKSVHDLKERTRYEEQILIEWKMSIFNFVFGGRGRIKFRLVQYSKIQSYPWKWDLCHLNKCTLLYSYKKFKEKIWSRFW